MEDLTSLRPLTHSEAFETVRSQAAIYPDFIRIYEPNVPFEKLKPNLELSNIRYPKAAQEKTSSEDYLERSVRRTRKLIKDYVLCNDFDFFVTFTFGDKRQDIDRCKKRMSDWLKNQRKRKGDFEYLIVAEFHKDGESLHFHALLKGYKGEISQAINPKTNKPIKDVFTIPSYTLGFNNVKVIKQDRDSRTKVGFYIQKYISKDMPLFANKNRFWASRGLKKPIIEDNPEPWYKHVKPDRTYKNEYGTILEFDRNKHPLTDMFFEANRP